MTFPTVAECPLSLCSRCCSRSLALMGSSGLAMSPGGARYIWLITFNKSDRLIKLLAVSGESCMLFIAVT